MQRLFTTYLLLFGCLSFIECEDDLDHLITEINAIEQRFEKTRQLLLRAVPLFSLGQPWDRDITESVLTFFEPRYTWLARRIEDVRSEPEASARYGYADEYPPRVGTHGVLVEVPPGGIVWEFPERQGRVRVVSKRGPRFRIVNVWREEVANHDAGAAPLFVADLEIASDTADTSEPDWASTWQSVLLNAGIDVEVMGCDAHTSEGCSDRENEFILKARRWNTKKQLLEVARLTKMPDVPMNREKAQWLAQRIAILKQLLASTKDEL